MLAENACAENRACTEKNVCTGKKKCTGKNALLSASTELGCLLQTNDSWPRVGVNAGGIHLHITEYFELGEQRCIAKST